MRPNGIITLTTDFGLVDSYVGTIKGVILGIAPAARLVDITHDISPQNTHQAAYIIQSFPGYFPPAQSYGGCQILIEAVKRAGSLDREKLRDAISKLDHNTVFGRFRVDRDGVQIGHKMLLSQWQDGRRVIVWPEELAAVKARFPTPPWSKRP